MAVGRRSSSGNHMATCLWIAGLATTVMAVAESGEGGRLHATPLQKVLELLNGMVAKGEQASHAEKVEFAEFKSWCEQTAKSTSRSIEEAAAQIVQLTADIETAETEAEQLASDISELESAIASDEGDLENATQIRHKEHEDYTATHKDYTESVMAVERAMQALRSRSADVPQSLLQLGKLSGFPAKDKATIEAFISAREISTETGVPEANAYEFQSGGVMKLLEKLRLKVQDERLTLEKAEISARSSHQMLADSLASRIQLSKKAMSAKTASKAQSLSAAAAAKGDAQVTEAAKAEDEKKLLDTQTECTSRAKEYDSNQAVRADELKALREAIEILSSDAVSGNGKTYLPSLLAEQDGVGSVALAQLRGGTHAEGLVEARQRAYVLLQDRARALGSKYLSLAAMRVASDPFAKVKKLLKQLIMKLMEEANTEADHNAFCKKELETNKMTREEKQSTVDELMARVEEKTAESTRLGDEISALSAELVEVREQLAQATQLRQEEKEQNNRTVSDARESQVAVERARQVLSSFYGRASEASLLQGGEALSQEMRLTSSAPYKGMHSEHGGIIGFLDVILSDFARLEAETSSSEDEAQASFEKFSAEASEDQAVKQAEMDHKTTARDRVEAVTHRLKEELEDTQTELDAAVEYYEKLKPDCVDNGLNYEERVASRKEEIQSLTEALQILKQEDLA
mmetsp:Transcript_16263/g.35588  ORF Transcript_16263/g.35588 Transcript_16263/m.35588 type:complete len:692 (+) Transcript_16263:37-2112(+)